jgi:hypothetical protein
MDLRKASWTPTRPLGGWLATSHEIMADGSLRPVSDREGQVFLASGSVDAVDLAPYIGWGLWNDEHRPTFVGVPTFLEFCGPDHPLAREHGKVGLWTEGHLFDGDDPASWEQFAKGRPADIWGAIPQPSAPLRPTEAELGRASMYWGLAKSIEALGRGIGFSAHGQSKVRNNTIVGARITQAAVCSIPMNPQATAQPLALSRRLTLDTPLSRAELADPLRRAEVARLLAETRGYTPEIAAAIVAAGAVHA